MTEIQASAKRSSEVAIEIMGKAYQVPEGLTMLQAMWHTGHALTRGVGCLGGICGACSASYRTKGDIRIKNGLACQTQVEEGMSFSLIYDRKERSKWSSTKRAEKRSTFKPGIV